MPFIVAHPEVSLLRCRAYAKKYGDRAAQKSDERALGRESAHSRTTPYGFGETRVATLALLTVTTAFTGLWGCYDQVLRPRRHLPQLANGLCRHSDASVYLDPHLIRQATKRYLERCNAFELIA
jgi:hypothetical protein